MPMMEQLSNYADIVLIYQDRYKVEKTISILQSLNISFKCVRMTKENHSKIIATQAKLIMLSSHHLITATEFYLDLLVQCQDQLCQHSSITLINNDEAQQAFTTCEDGLFDNYVIISPELEDARLNLVILQSLKKIEEEKIDQATQSIIEGDENKPYDFEQNHSLERDLKTQINQCQLKINNALSTLITDTNCLKQVEQNVNQALDTLSNNISTHASMHSHKLIANIQNVTFKNLLNNKKLINRLSSAEPSVNKSSLNALTTPSYKILIAESSMLFANSVAEIFEDMNFQVRITVDGKKTLQAFTDFQPDIVLIENNLAQINGIEVTRKIRNRGSCVPIITIIDNHEKSLLKQWIPLGISAYLYKSAEHSDILDTVVSELLNPTGLLKFHTENNIDQIKWLPEYSVGNELMDSHHKALFNIIKVFLSSEPKHTLKIFKKIKQYITMHFSAEEKLLKKHQYPDYESHKKEHTALINKVARMEHKLAANETDIHNKVGLFLYKWLSHHILKSDMAYKPFLTVEQHHFDIDKISLD